MHELAITESVVTGVCEHLEQAGRAGSRVTRVVLEIGRLSGVVPDAIRFCFDVCTQRTPLEGAGLEIVAVEGVARCRSCGMESQPRDLLALCGCGSGDLEIRSGRELRVREVEVI